MTTNGPHTVGLSGTTGHSWTSDEKNPPKPAIWTQWEAEQQGRYILTPYIPHHPVPSTPPTPSPTSPFSKTSSRTLEGRPTMSGGFLASQVKVPLSLKSRFLIRMEPSRRPGFPTNSSRSLNGPLLSK